MFESILQDLRAWIVLATSLPAARVIPEDDPATRKALPYITMNFITYDTQVGTDETHYEVDDEEALRALTTGDRVATLSVNSYGKAGPDLISLLLMSLRQPIVQRFLFDKQLSVRPIGSTQNLTQTVDTTREARHQRDFEIGYALELEQEEPETEMELFGMVAELDKDPEFSDPIIVDVEVE